MCGRFGLTRDPRDLARRLGSRSSGKPFIPRFNIAPTQVVEAIRNDEERSRSSMRWGLVPSWAASPAAIKLSTFNARIETIATAPTYRGPTRSRRCVIFADGFYEWRRDHDDPKRKTPFWIHRRDGEPFAFAGLWDTWRSRGGEEEVSSCTIVTAPANEFMAPVHNRMPVVLDDDRARAWLASEPIDGSAAVDILVPAENANIWEMYPVSPRVGNVRNTDATLIDRAAPA